MQMNYEDALGIVEKYFNSTVFTLEQTEAFEVILEKCAKTAKTET